MPSVKLAMGVGGAFDYLSGKIKRAPEGWRSKGLEWLYRLLRQPKRLKRIWQASIVFPWNIFIKSINKNNIKNQNGTTTIEKIGIFFSIIGVITTFFLSIKSLNISKNIREDNRKINQLNLKPEINFTINFNIKNQNPYFIITNTGPIEIIDSSVQLIAYLYSEKTDSALSIFSNGVIEETFYIGEIKTLESKQYEIKKEILKTSIVVDSFLGSIYQNKNILEARIKYRKNPDKELFIKRAFYFLDSDKGWINESSLFFSVSKYEKEVEWIKHNKNNYFNGDFSDKLYDYNQ
jgi:hypothetical protein